jgi:hypothetical protein
MVIFISNQNWASLYASNMSFMESSQDMPVRCSYLYMALTLNVGVEYFAETLVHFCRTS